MKYIILKNPKHFVFIVVILGLILIVDHPVLILSMPDSFIDEIHDMDLSGLYNMMNIFQDMAGNSNVTSHSTCPQHKKQKTSHTNTNSVSIDTTSTITTAIKNETGHNSNERQDLPTNILDDIKPNPPNLTIPQCNFIPTNNAYNHHHHTQCISLIENYDQGLGREERRQFIPIEKSVIKESLDLLKALNEREICNYPDFSIVNPMEARPQQFGPIPTLPLSIPPAPVDTSSIVSSVIEPGSMTNSFLLGNMNHGNFHGSSPPMGLELSPQRVLQFQSANTGIFGLESLPSNSDISLKYPLNLYNEVSSQLVSGATNSALTFDEISSSNDPSFHEKSSEQKKEKINRYLQKRKERTFDNKIKYECRKTLADSRPRVHGRFVKKDDSGNSHNRDINHHDNDDNDDTDT